ncbi:hypothetical protein ACSQ67_025177 [Phaseolus vulgaris]
MSTQGSQRHGHGVTTWEAILPPQSRPNPSIWKLDAHLTWVEVREYGVGKTPRIGCNWFDPLRDWWHLHKRVGTRKRNPLYHAPGPHSKYLVNLHKE